MRIKYARKFSRFYVAVKCTITGGQNRYGLVCAVMINPLELPINDEARNEAQVCDDISTKNETGTSDTS